MSGKPVGAMYAGARRRLIRSVSTAFFIGCASMTARAQAIDFELFTRLTHKVIKIEAMNPDGSISMGTGVIVGHGFVITNCHVTARARTVELVRGETRWQVDSQQADVEHDLCLLSAPHAADAAPVEMGSDTPRIGQTVHAVGFIFGIAPRLNVGEINALHDYDGGKVIQSTTPFTSGASGGGLFDDKGRLVGIVTFRYRAGSAHHFSLPVSWVIDAMTHFTGRPIAPLGGVPFWGRPRDQQPLFLRAATFDAEQDWRAMADVAQQWTQDEAANPSAWRALGKARFEQHDYPEAIAALRRSISLEVDQAPTWHALGLAYASTGNHFETERVHQVLLGLDGKLAGVLAKQTLDCGGPVIRVC